MNEIRYFSMFTGVGGFELGFNNVTQPQNKRSKEGWKWSINQQQALIHDRSNTSLCFKPIGFSEIDKYASELLSKKFPTIKNLGDCTKINPSELPDFDMLCGGFPCQSFSIAGKRKGFEDTRGTMFFEIARILEVKRPKIILLENVKGLLNHEKGETFRVILQTMDELGYEVQWMVLNSKFFGVPQNRERVFIIGSLRGEPRQEILPFRETEQQFNSEGVVHPTLTEAIGRQGSSKEYIKSIEVIGNLNSETWRKRNESIRRVYGTEGISPTIPTGQGGGVMPKIRAVLTPDRAEKRQNGRRFKEPGEPSFTITKQDIHGVAIMDLYNNKEHSDRCPTLSDPCHNSIRVRENMKIRKLTPIECERLQGFPDGWTEGFSDTQRYKMMGNAVTVNVIKEIGFKLLNSIKREGF